MKVLLTNDDGIGHPGIKSEVSDYVLKKPSPDDRLLIDKASEQALDSLNFLLAGEMDKALARIHAQPPRPKPPRAVRPQDSSDTGPPAPGETP